MKRRYKYGANLNAAGKLTLVFLHSKLTLLIILSSVLFGVLALLYTPRTYNPEIVVPVVNISVSRPGSDAQEMLRQIVRPLEALMAAIPGVDHTYGIAIDDNAIVTVRFKINENEENSLVKVYNQINSNMDHIPAGTLPPLIQSVSLYDVPLVTLTLSGAHYSAVALHDMATRLLIQLRNVPQVGKSWVAGTSVPTVRVWLDPLKLAAYNIPLQNVKQALQANNTGADAGKLESGNIDTALQINAELMNPDEVGNVVVGVFNAKPVYLHDIAKIEIAPENDDIRSYFAFGQAAGKQYQPGRLQPAVTIALARQKGSNGVDVADAILDKFNTLKKTLPPGITATVTRNYGSDANDAVNTLIEHLCIAIFAVVMILLLFLGWREASIVIFSIPLILFLVLGVGWITGQTINRITLFALILSLGLLVDDSIVVIENIHRHIRHHPQPNFGRLIVTAANEIGRPTIVATFTVMLALIPMVFVTGMMGPFMQPIPFNAPLAMFISLLIAYTVVPYLAYRWLKRKARKTMLAKLEQEPPTAVLADPSSLPDSFLHRWYIRLFQPLMTSPWKRRMFYGSVFLILILAMLQPLWQFIRPGGANGPLSWMGVELKMLPDDNVNTFLIEIDMTTGTALQETERVAQAVANTLVKNPYITNYQVFLGKSAPEDFAAMVRGDAMQQGSYYAQIRVNLLDKHQRKPGSHEIAQSVYASLSGVRQAFPEARIKLFETPPGPPVRSQMEAGLYGASYPELQNIAQYIVSQIYPHIYGMINIDSSVTQNLPEYQILVDRNKAVMAGLVPSTLTDAVAAYFAGVNVGSIHQPGDQEPVNIVLRLPATSRENFTALGNVYLLNRQNNMIPLASIAEFKKTIQDKPIYTRDQHEVVYVTGEMLKSSPVYAVTTGTKRLNGLALPDGTRLQVGDLGFKEAQPDDVAHTQLFWLGEMRLTLDVFRDLGTAFIVALLLIYILLTGFYRSFFIPIIIMGAIPLTLIGVFPGHWLTHEPFTATSLIGVIALAGIVVRNSLLLIDFILEHQRQGASIESAVMHAGVVRLLPILLTALAIMFGSSVMITDPVFGGLAVSLIFGAFASTTLTLFVIPLVYLSWKNWGKPALKPDVDVPEDTLTNCK
ncbi:MAG: efflux RND transporter permease subunit [Legionellales bacterium]|nr:efflux RND transporter permease subunit [Legionellales bacterium]